jgi:hypothetical protein
MMAVPVVVVVEWLSGCAAAAVVKEREREKERERDVTQPGVLQH